MTASPIAKPWHPFRRMGCGMRCSICLLLLISMAIVLQTWLEQEGKSKEDVCTPTFSPSTETSCCDHEASALTLVATAKLKVLSSNKQLPNYALITAVLAASQGKLPLGQCANMICI